MKVVQWNTAKVLGGAELRTLELTKALIKKGHQVYIICRKNSFFENKLKQEHMNIIAYKNPFVGFIKILVFLKNWKPDIIHVHSGKDYAISIILGMLNSIPVVIHRRLMSKVNPITKFLINNWKTKIIAISKATKEILIKENKFEEEKIELVYNAIPQERLKFDSDKIIQLQHHFDKKNKKIDLSVGNLYPTKGFEELIKVAKILKEKIKNLLVLIAGEGEERKKLEKLIIQYNLSDTVKLLGFRNDVIELLKICDCFVLLSYEEPFGVAFIEALGCGKPVVGYRCGGLPEIIADNEVGYLVEPHDINAVCEKLEKILLDEELAKKLGTNAKRYFDCKFSFNNMIEKIENIFYELKNLTNNKE